MSAIKKSAKACFNSQSLVCNSLCNLSQLYNVFLSIIDSFSKPLKDDELRRVDKFAKLGLVSFT